MAASSASLVFLSSLLLVASHLSLSTAQATPPLVPGLSYDFYRTSCPSLEPTIREYLREIFNSDFGLAPGLLRVHFHDCFVQGCEGSVLLEGSVAGPGEQGAPPNLSLRPRAFVVINELRNRIHRACGPIVSCSDITAICARDSVFLLGGPDYRVPLGRRDGLDFATIETTNANLPSFRSNASVLLTQFASRGLDATDLVALSGGHTYGRANCGTMVPRLYPTQDPTMNSTLAANLTRVCPTPTSAGVNPLDVITPNPFDNAYYRGLLQRLGMFTSDQDLFNNTVTRPIVTSFANNQTLFFQRFAFSMIRMSMMNVLTGTQGEIRTNCSRRNSATSNLYDLVDGEGRSAAF